MNQDLKKIGKRIKLLRIERNVSQTDLAVSLGISQTNMSNIECGRGAVTLQNLIRLQQLLGCPIEDFFQDIESCIQAAENAATARDVRRSRRMRLMDSLDD